MRAIVVGAGVGGLAAAAGLHARGWHVTVLERRPDLSGGAALSLWPNATYALDRLGVTAEELRHGGPLGGQGGIRRPDGRWIARTALGPAIVERFGRPLVLVRRADLAGALAARLPADRLRLGVTVATVGPGDGATPATVTTGTGEDLVADLVVAADGIRSTVRRQLFPDHPGPRYAGYTSWRLVADLPPHAGPGSETWGARGERFAIVPLDAGRCYCYATAILPPAAACDDERAELLRRFGSWHAPVPDILASLGPGDVLRDDIEEIAEPLPAMHAGRVAVLGDAAHAMTPELGQGGCQAIEDAVVLAATVGDGRPGAASPAVTLPRYTAARLARTADVTRRSRRAGALHRGPAALARLAARVMGAVPARGVVRGLAPVVGWRPPPA